MRIFINNKITAFLCGVLGFLFVIGGFLELLGFERRDLFLGLILVSLSVILYELIDLRKEIK